MIDALRLSVAAQRLAVFAVVALALAAAFFGAAQSMVSVWATSSVYHHGFLVAPLAFWMAARERMATAPAPDFAGVAIIGIAAALFVFGRAASVDIIQHVALVIALIGAVIASVGRAQARRWAFPLGFLFFMVPFGEELTPVMQHWASIAVAAALNASGVETARDGFILSTSAGRFEMAASCAGLRFLLAAAMISTFVSFLAFRDFNKRAIFIVAALAASILANWLRAFALVYATTVTDGRIGVGPEHVALGWVFYVVLVFGMMALARHFADKDQPQRASIMRRDEPSARQSSALVVAAAATVLIAMSAYDRAIVSRTVLSPIDSPRFASAAFEPIAAKPDWRAYAPAAGRLDTESFISAQGVVTVSAANFSADRDGAEIAGATTRAADGEDWRRVAITSEQFSIGDRRLKLRLETISNGAGERLDVATLYRLGDEFYASPLALKFAVAMRRLTARPTEGAAIYIATQTDKTSSARIAAFLAGAE